MFSRVGTTQVMDDDDNEVDLDVEDGVLGVDVPKQTTPTKRKRGAASTHQVDGAPSSPSKRGRRKQVGTGVMNKRDRPVKATITHQSSSGEDFDFGGIDPNPDPDDSGDGGLPAPVPFKSPVTPKRRARPPHASLVVDSDDERLPPAPAPVFVNSPSGSKRRGRPPRKAPLADSSGEEFDFGGIDSNPELSDSPSPVRRRSTPKSTSKATSSRQLHRLASPDAIMIERMSTLSVSSPSPERMDYL